MARLEEIAKTIRSKNAGVNQITFDIIFPDAASYRRVVSSGAVTRETVARLYGIEELASALVAQQEAILLSSRELERAVPRPREPFTAHLAPEEA